MKKDDIRLKLLNYKNKTISLDKLSNIIADEDISKIKDFNTFKYDELALIVMELIKQQAILPKGKNNRGVQKKGTTDNRKYNLPLNYDINKGYEDKNMPQKYLTEIKWLDKRIDTSKNVFKDVYLYEKFREKILIIDNYLKSGIEKEIISVNERSYELFGDEKFLSGQDEKKDEPEFLPLLGLKEEELHCKSNYKPLLIFASSTYYTKERRTILIVENLDTYWTFQKFIFKDKGIECVDMIIYGAGNKITGGLSTYKQYEITSEDKVLYFGDIDSAGFNFYLEIKKKYPLRVNLFREAYEMLIDCTADKKKLNNRGEKQIKLSAEKLEVVLSEFPIVKHKITITELIRENKYIPQEGLNYSILKERWRLDG